MASRSPALDQVDVNEMKQAAAVMNDEAAIRRQVDDLLQAIRAMDLNRVTQMLPPTWFRSTWFRSLRSSRAVPLHSRTASIGSAAQ